MHRLACRFDPEWEIGKCPAVKVATCSIESISVIIMYNAGTCSKIKKHVRGHTQGSLRPWPIEGLLRPSSNKKSFPVHRPGGLKSAYWNFIFPDFNFFFTFPPCTF